MESLIEPYLDKRCDFTLFRSNTCHKLKELGDIDFVIEVLEKDEIRWYYKKQFCTQYDDIRKMKLQNMLFPSGVLAAAEITKDQEVKEQAIKDSIPEFLRFNIVESEVRNGKSMPAEIVLVGGAAILTNYGFRNMTTDIDAVIHAASTIKDAQFL